MTDFDIKFQKSKFPLLVCGLLILAITALTVEKSVVPKIIPIEKERKTIEEIMQTPVDAIKQEPWDKDFKSTIIPEGK